MPAKARDFGLWTGDEQSFTVASEAFQWVLKHPSETAEYKEKFSDEEDLLDTLVGEIYQTQDNVAILNISGAMVNTDSYWNLIFGLTSYNTVAAALNRAVEDNDITDIVLNLSTSGGDAEGIGAVSENIKVAKQSKPVYAYSNTKALSAGYWMAASADKIYGAPMSEWGSVGALIVHTSMARAVKDRGYDVTVFRGGEFKALGHPAEKLSDKAKKYLQGKVEKLYNFFLKEISGERPSLKVENKEIWAEGKVFFAEDAVTVGLVDEVISFNALISSLVAVDENDLGVPSSQGTVGLNNEANVMTKQVILDPVAQAQVASGVDLTEVPHSEADTPTEAEGALDTGSNASENSEASEDPRPSETAGGSEADSSSMQDAPTEIVSFLKSELSEARSQLAEATSELITLKAEAAQAEADISGLKEVAVEATQKLQVALGQTPVNMDSLSAEAVIKQYEVGKTAFLSRFKVGQQSLSVDEAGSVEDSDQEARKFGLVPKHSA